MLFLHTSLISVVALKPQLPAIVESKNAAAISQRQWFYWIQDALLTGLHAGGSFDQSFDKINSSAARTSRDTRCHAGIVSFLKHLLRSTVCSAVIALVMAGLLYGIS
jgi:hypothetical protein